MPKIQFREDVSVELQDEEDEFVLTVEIGVAPGLRRYVKLHAPKEEVNAFLDVLLGMEEKDVPDREDGRGEGQAEGL